MRVTRRRFISRGSLGLAAAGGALWLPASAPAQAAADAQSAAAPAPAAARPGGTPKRPMVISTWGFGRPANDTALKILNENGTILDAVEQGIRVVEASGNSSVGLAGIPNAAGVVQLDACIMSGPGHRAGSVAALEGIRFPITAARRVMEKTSHVMLVGEGARLFALEEGLESVEIRSAERYEAWRQKRAAAKTNAPPASTTPPSTPARKPPSNHDTIALLVLDANGNLAGGCSTSGWAGKLPGRVGDSPLIGGGLYVDNDVGAAGATGLGENILRYCGSFLVVELMRQGLAPEEACLEAIRRIARKDHPKGANLSINFIALDKQGRVGAAGSARGFTYAVASREGSTVRTAPGIGRVDIGPEGGNRK
jgi:N4-(beta-N-acetylglucosaminyl)-L-asparaginase